VRDAAIFAAMILAFATAVTAHVGIVAGLAMRTPRWRAPVALFVAPLAPYWALRNGMRLRAALWVAALLTYLIARR